MSALNEDRGLLNLFLRDLVLVTPPVDATKLTVLEQQYPGEEEPSEDDLDRRGIPDGWIFSEEEAWCVFIETKVTAKLRAEQIRSHRRTAARRGFQVITAVAIAPRLPGPVADEAVHLEWRKVYAWLCKQKSKSYWALQVANFLEIAEAKLASTGQFREGTLTMFAGFPFGPDHPYTYLDGKRVLGLALAELRSRPDLRKILGMNPAILGRSAITGRGGEMVWDFLSLSDADDAATFTHYPHLTLGVGARTVEAMITIPNAINKTMRQNLKKLGQKGFQALAQNIVTNLTPLLRTHDGIVPWFRGVQRRYPSQRATPHLDAWIDFDLRTAAPMDNGPKGQVRWLDAAYGAFINKDGTNYQMQMGMHFRYEHCAEIRQPTALDLIAKAWLGCKPLVDLTR